MPRLLDLCCGAGGAAMGYSYAGFDRIEGWDIIPQPNYPFLFTQGDILDLDPQWIADNFEAAHTSVPCQRFSAMSIADTYADLVDFTRTLLDASGVPYVIENVVGAPLRDPVMLCGQMFGRDLYRHRLFEANFPLAQPEHPAHTTPASKAGHWTPGTIMSVAGHIAPVAEGRRVMEIDWTTRDELGEAIPPYYTQYVGAQLMAEVERRQEAAA